MMEIREKYCHSSNFKVSDRSEISYIVIHYTGNKGDTAENNAAYFARTANLSASAHYFVDENEVWRSVRECDIAWHCGASSYRHEKCRNANSIGVEICMWDKNGGLRQESIDRAAVLVRELMEKYGVTADRVLRHYDVTGKSCPAPMVESPKLWETFLESLTRREEMQEVRYDKVADLPGYAQPTIVKMIDKGLLSGSGTVKDENGRPADLDLSLDMIRVFVTNDRVGLYD